VLLFWEQFDPTALFDGLELSFAGDTVPADMKLLTIPEGLYAVLPL
jgi:hypothetical protein